MPGEPRETRVLAAVVALVDSLLHDFDVVELLTQLTERCAELLDVESAGLLLADPRGQLHLMAATSERTEEIELFQLQADEGPCLDCFVTGTPTSIADLGAATERWPRFGPAATRAGFASVHAVPMRAAGSVLGALGLFGGRVGELNDADRLVAQTLAHIACVAILREPALTPATVAPDVRAALVSRVVVEQAKGYLSERFDISVAEAFTLLRRYAQTSKSHLTEVARQLITGTPNRDGLETALRGTPGPPS